MPSEGDQAGGDGGGLLKVASVLLRPALALPRAAIATVDQVVTAWDAVRAIPEIRDSLASIEYDTRTMTSEVTSMRQGVDTLQGEIGGLNGSVEVLGERLDDVGKVVRPLKRIGDRLRGPVVPEIEDAVAEAAVEPLPESELG
jgi:hypothetical protein